MLSQTIEKITVDQLRFMLDHGEPVIILDVRQESMYREKPYTIPGAILVPPYLMDDYVPPLNHEPRPIIVYCACRDEATSTRFACELRRKGFTAWTLRGGLDAWLNADYPVEPIQCEHFAY